MTAPLTHDELARTARSLDAMPQMRASPGAAPFARILVATDGGAASGAAMDWAALLAPGARTWIVHAVPVASTLAWGIGLAGSPTPAQIVETNEQARVILEDAQRRVRPTGGDALIAYGDPAREILALADSIKAELIIVGSRGLLGIERAVLGSVADAIRRKSKASLLIARSPPGHGAILVPVDGSPNATRAAGIGATLAARLDRDLTLLHVRTSEDASDLAPLGLARVPGRLTEVVVAGDPAERILEAVSIERPTLLVMGARGLGRVRGFLMGSVSTTLSRDAPTNVLVVRGERA